MRGVARSVDLARGTVTIQSDGQETELQGHPADLAQVQPGSEVVLSFVTYGDASRWLAPRADARDVLESSSSIGQITGEIEGVDPGAGIVTVAGQTFHAHPSRLTELRPGEQVSISYAQIEGNAWAADVEPGGQGTATVVGTTEEREGDDIDWYFETPS